MRHQKFEPAYFDEAVETMPRGALRDLQLLRLKETLNRAYRNVPHYREAFDALGVTPDDLNTLEDLTRFPFTTKNDLRVGYPFNMFAVPQEDVVRLHASSGTTGRPTVVGYTRDDVDVWAQLVARCFVATGATKRDIAHIAYGYGLFTGGLGAHYGAERLGCAVVPMSGGNTEKQVLLISDFGATIICGTPSYVLNIAEEAEKKGVDLRGGPLRIGIFGAEPWSQALRQELESRLGIRAYDIYGLSEIMGPGVAMECTEQCGLHGWEDHFLFEVIDSETMEPLPPGEEGELVITTLTKQALPMIRYRTRDITRLSVEPCACGRTHARILRVAGRNDDMMIIRGVNVYPSQLESVMIGVEGFSPHYQLVLQREGNLDSLTIEVEANPGIDPAHYGAMAKQMRHSIKSIVGVSTRVIVLGPGEIPRSQGKAVRVRDLRRKD
ncbi:phenylacetate--CoA ligase [Phaeovibrio sulfidiphilus]|uniref:Phenylacetate-coenzyme A ligase n=1 Tax=Phaeovibrio sulfidiphilus TaxID=1220600 RepID=A0A8J7CQ44_9PROT|nr:phenylacetate--CoA ligase [Phaeovibrio sulfidiphilus]MBE1237832.1 phenylacetate--CoA ligase [Phaeovibrio sulfidiphilus]